MKKGEKDISLEFTLATIVKSSAQHLSNQHGKF
jgi:hypothetical protein